MDLDFLFLMFVADCIIVNHHVSPAFGSEYILPHKFSSCIDENCGKIPRIEAITALGRQQQLAPSTTTP